MKFLVLALTLVGSSMAWAQPCAEGARGLFYFQGSGGHTYSQLRTCRNGSYMTEAERAAYVHNPRSTCQDGRLGLSFLTNPGSSKTKVIRLVCINGKYVRAH